MKTTKFLSIIIAATVFLNISCKTENPPDDPNNPSDPMAVVNLLHDKAQWESVYDSMMLVLALVGRENSSKAGFSDFTVDTKNQLNLVFWTWWQSQQDGIYTCYRKSIDLGTKKSAVLNLNSFAMSQYKKSIEKNPPYFSYGVSYYSLIMEAFKPYTNYYVNGFQYYKNGQKWYLLKEQAVNNDYAKANFSDFQSGDFDMTFRNPTVNLSPRGFFTFGANMNDESQNFLGTIHKHFYYQEANATHGGLTEPRVSGKSLAIEFRANELEATELESGFGAQPNTEVEWMVKRTSVAKLALTTPLELPLKTHRHYSVDGNILSFYIYNEKTDKYSTFVYNFTTKAFTQKLDNVSITYGEKDKSDLDLDEEGNIYYTGYGKNGTDKTATSVYKLSPGGASTLVGSDSFLKYGTVEKLKYLHGKVYLGVVGTRENTAYRQITVLRQK